MNEYTNVIGLTPAECESLIRLADAIEAGSKKRPQTHGVLWGLMRTSEQEEIGSCAFGAAWEGVHPEFSYVQWKFPGLIDILEEFRVEYISIPHPEIDTAPLSQVKNVIVNLNDGYLWTRERIASYLRQCAK